MRIFQKNQHARRARNDTARNDLGSFNHPSLHYRKPKALRRFQAALTFGASAALVFGLWSFAWYAMSALVKAEVKGWIDTQRSLGAIAGYATMETAGFPARITLTLSEPQYEGPAFGETVRWQSDILKIQARPWTPWKLHVEAPGTHDLRLGALDFSGAAEQLVADVVLGDVWPEELDLHIRALSMDGAAPLALDSLRLGFSHNPDAQGSATGVNLTLSGENITVPGGLPEPLGGRVQSLDVAARILGSVRPGRAQDRVPAWRDGGGVIDVERFKFRGGPLAFTAGGTASLDSDLQPQGAFTAKIEGLFQVMEILRAKGVMRDADAVVAMMALSALSKRPKNGGAASINLGVTLQDGAVSLGPLKVMKMPRLNWGFPMHPDAPPPAPEETKPPRDYKDVKPIF